MKKLVIIGPPAVGKSTLANKLGNIFDVPVIHLDTYFWKPGWVPTTLKERINKLEKLINKYDSWIIDGNYENVIDYQLGITNGVILLDFPRYICLWRAIKRRFSLIGIQRPEIAPGCPDKLDFGLLKSIWLYPLHEGQFVKKKIGEYQPTLFVVRLRSPSEAKQFLVKATKLKGLPLSSLMTITIDKEVPGSLA